MPYANNQGVRIHYEAQGSGSPLVLVHGFGSDLESWQDSGYVEPLKKSYKLVLVDVRGHGGSDKPHDPQAYTLKTLVADIAGVLDDLGVNKAHFMGYSMGGWIGFGIAKHALERFQCLIIGGASPYRNPGAPNYSLELCNKILKMPMPAREEFAEAFHKKALGPRLTPQLKARLMASDVEALRAISSTEDWMLSLENVLPTINVPCLVFVGEADGTYSGAKRCAESIPNATFVSFPNLGHIETRYRSDLVLPHVTKFLEKGVRIRYEVEGNGPPLVLVQGLVGYLETWHEWGYIDSLKKHYMPIPMDIRGHGGSDKPHDPEVYKLELLAADVIARA